MGSCVSNHTDEPLVSVVMNCYNSARYLREAIDSVYDQTYRNWEIVFWDNASSDRSGEIAQSYDSRLRYFRGENLVKLYSARNSALEMCSGKAIAFLDCDDIWLPDKLELQIAAFNKGNALVYGGYEVVDDTGNPMGQIVNSNLSGWLTNALLKKNFISIGCVLIEAALAKRYRFNPDYDLLGDFDLWIRLSLDHPLTSVGRVVERSRCHAHNTSDTLRKSWLHERRKFYRDFLHKTSLVKYPEIYKYVLKTELKGLANVR